MAFRAGKKKKQHTQLRTTVVLLSQGPVSQIKNKKTESEGKMTLAAIFLLAGAVAAALLPPPSRRR